MGTTPTRIIPSTSYQPPAVLGRQAVGSASPNGLGVVLSPIPGNANGQVGFTLLEVVVVLVLLALAAAIVAPSLLSTHPENASEIQALVGSTRQAAIRRGETVRLRVNRSGAWQAIAGTEPGSDLLMSGQLAGQPATTTDLIFSPLGTCAPAVESGSVVALDPLTCEVELP